MLYIGPWLIDNPTVLAPMAGVTDRPFRQLCHQLGAGLTVSEMVTADKSLWGSNKSRQRLAHAGDIAPRSVQIAGSDPSMMAEAARANQALGAQIIDINMGCPAKKVCKKAAGSALLRDEALVREILTAVVDAVDIPVTLKIRTGWSLSERNGTTIAKIAETSGIQALTVHGRTKECAFKGKVEYDTIAAIVDSIDIPVIANGDIDSPQKAAYVLQYTGADAVMIGRAAQGNPWLFGQINAYLKTGTIIATPTSREVCSVLTSHIQALHEFYGSFMGVRITRKHLGWYLKGLKADTINTESFRRTFNRLELAEEQLDSIQTFFEHLPQTEEQAA